MSSFFLCHDGDRHNFFFFLCHDGDRRDSFFFLCHDGDRSDFLFFLCHDGDRRDFCSSFVVTETIATPHFPVVLTGTGATLYSSFVYLYLAVAWSSELFVFHCGLEFRAFGMFRAAEEDPLEQTPHQSLQPTTTILSTSCASGGRLLGCGRRSKKHVIMSSGNLMPCNACNGM